MVKHLIRENPTASAICIYIAFVLLAGIASMLMEQAGVAEVSWVGFIIYCIMTGIIEEAVFTGLIFGLLRVSANAHKLTFAMGATAVLFGLAHLSLAAGLGIALLKVLQACPFSICMLYIYVRAAKLAIPMAVHSAFDILWFAIPFMRTGMLPPYPEALAPDANIALLAGTTLLFAICAAIIFRRLTKTT